MEHFDFYNESQAIINPKDFISSSPVPETFVLFFFSSSFQNSLKEKKRWPGFPPDYYQFNNIGIKRLPMGAAMSALTLELLIESGAKKFIVIGTACSLKKNLMPSTPVLITSAIREEGVSYHYFPYSRIIKNTSSQDKVLQQFLNIPDVQSYTTSAFFRETEEKILKIIQEGSAVIEMEAASLIAVAKFRKVNLSIIAFISDSIINLKWEQHNRDYKNENKMIKKIIDFACQL